MNHELCIHEKDIMGQSRKIAELETKSAYKEDDIKELKKDIKKIENDIKIVNDNLNKLLLNSQSDDSKLSERLKTIETRLDAQEQLAITQKQLAKENQEDITRKTNLKIAIVGVILTAISVILPIISIFKGG